MPVDYREYPADWHAISRRLRAERAGGRCECDGKCGHHHPPDPGSGIGRCDAVNGEPHPRTGSRVVLTVAHWPDPTKSNVAEDNLHALCQACHLSLDRDHHARNRRYGRKHAGPHQARLFDTLT